MSDAPPEELRRKLPHDPRLWIRNYLRHPNDPKRAYDFHTTDKSKFLYYLADDEGPMNPEQWGDINILLFARGSLKTFSVSSIAAWGVDMFSSLEVAATAPRDDQREEVIDRFRVKAEQSGLMDRAEANSMRHMKFKNTAVDPDTGERHPAYSHLKSRSAWDEGNALRGLHGHVGVIDESQDVDEGTFSTFLEAIDREVPSVDYFPTIFVIGTPKMANTFFHRLWRMSDKKSWDRDSREWIQESEPNDFMPEEMQEKKKEVEEKLVKLREQDGDPELIERFEEKLDEFEGFTVRGWHIDQYNSPLHDDREIAFKKETYSKRKFENEVKANFYSPEHDLITNDDVWEAFDDDERMPLPEPRWEGTKRYLGVDWGGGKGEGAAETVIVVAEEHPEHERLHVLNIEILDPDLSAKEERERIDSLMQSYDVQVGVVDEGYGDTDREELQDEYGYDERGDQTIYGCWYGNVKDKEEIKWNRFEEKKRFFTTAKTFMVKSMAEDFKDGKIRIPKDGLSFDSRRSKGTKIVEQLTAPYTDKKETQGGKTKKVVMSDRADDVFDALTYVWIAWQRVDSGRTLKKIGSTKRKGY